MEGTPGTRARASTPSWPLLAELPAAVQARARCLHLVGWLVHVIDTPRLIWDADGGPAAFDDELKLMRAWRTKAVAKGAITPPRQPGN